LGGPLFPPTALRAEPYESGKSRLFQEVAEMAQRLGPPR
jgi:hypothetical protein